MPSGTRSFQSGVDFFAGRINMKRPPVYTTNPLAQCCLETEPPEGFGFIYQVEFPCGMVYIGQTTRSVASRLQNHGRVLKDRVTRKYKVPPFAERLFLRSDVSRIVVTILDCVPRSELDFEESYHIILRRTKRPFGANTRPGQRTWGRPLYGDIFGENVKIS